MIALERQTRLQLHKLPKNQEILKLLSFSSWKMDDIQKAKDLIEAFKQPNDESELRVVEIFN